MQAPETCPRAERRAVPKPARVPPGDRPMYPSDEGLTFPRAAIGQRPMAFSRHRQSAGTVRVRPQLTKPARVPSGDRPMYASDEGLQ